MQMRQDPFRQTAHRVITNPRKNGIPHFIKQGTAKTQCTISQKQYNGQCNNRTFCGIERVDNFLQHQWHTNDSDLGQNQADQCQ